MSGGVRGRGLVTPSYSIAHSQPWNLLLSSRCLAFASVSFRKQNRLFAAQDRDDQENECDEDTDEESAMKGQTRALAVFDETLTFGLEGQVGCGSLLRCGLLGGFAVLGL